MWRNCTSFGWRFQTKASTPAFKSSSTCKSSFNHFFAFGFWFCNLRDGIMISQIRADSNEDGRITRDEVQEVSPSLFCFIITQKRRRFLTPIPTTADFAKCFRKQPGETQGASRGIRFTNHGRTRPRKPRLHRGTKFNSILFLIFF